MSIPVKIVLVGLPGSGKSTFGRTLANQLNLEYVDLDFYIEKQSGKKIRDIFQEEGEGVFRELETARLHEILENTEGFVLSTGGGTPCYNDNMDYINQYSISVYLEVSLSEILNRLHNDELTKRPLFSGLDEGEVILKLKNLLAERGPHYNQAKIKLSGEDISTEHLTSELMNFFKN